MREGWVQRSLGEVCTLQRGFDLPKKQRQHGSVPLVSSSGCIDTHVKARVEGPGVVTGRSGSIGSVFFIEDDYWPLNTTLYVKDFHGNDPRFIYHLLNRFDLKRFASGAGVPTLNRNNVHSEKVLLPGSLPEQKRIVAILDDAFEGIGRAAANAEKNLANARELFESYLNAVFTQKGEGWVEGHIEEFAEVFDGPHATPKTVEDGPIFLGISALQDGVINLGKTRHVTDTIYRKWTRRVKPRVDDVVFSYETRLGQAAIIPEGLECCLGRRMGLVRMNKNTVEPEFFVYQYISPPYRRFLASQTIRGTTVDRIPLKKFPSFPFSYPSLGEQRRIMGDIADIVNHVERLKTVYEKQLKDLAELKQSILQKAFAGELTSGLKSPQPAEAIKSAEVKTTSPEFTANVLAFAHYRHVANQRDKTYGRVKAQKTLHLTESIGGIDLGRNPVKDAAGPNDFPHMLKAEEWAKANQFFEFVKKGGGYKFKKLSRYNEMISEALESTKPYRKELEKIVDLVLPMKSREAELFATVHAAWNNLILDEAEITDKSIIQEARDNWHPDKTKIPVSEFRKAIRIIRDKGVVPDGKAKRVGGQGQLL